MSPSGDHKKSELMTFSMYVNACPASRYQFQQNDRNLLSCARDLGALTSKVRPEYSNDHSH